MYMEENKIHLINQIDLNKIIYSKVNEMNDKKLIHIYYENPGQKLLFQTPQLLNIFDIQKSKYFNELILPLYDCNLKVPLLTQFFKDLDSKDHNILINNFKQKIKDKQRKTNEKSKIKRKRKDKDVDVAIKEEKLGEGYSEDEGEGVGVYEDEGEGVYEDEGEGEGVYEDEGESVFMDE